MVTEDLLKRHPECIFVFGDNVLRRGRGGAAALRPLPQMYGFITKKVPDHNPTSYYSVQEYYNVFDVELTKLIHTIQAMPTTIFLVSPVGSGIANRYGIWDSIIKPGLESLRKFKNVIFTEEIDDEKDISIRG